ncbi:MAG: hypothetical protein NSGCLCUN01_01298 [uncultured Clostridium sp.]
MSTFVLKREYALAMPTSYIDIDRDEMEYVDGGAFVYRWAVTMTLDVIAMAFGLGAILAPIKYGGKKMAQIAIRNNIGTIKTAVARFIGSTSVSLTTNTILNLLLPNLSCLFSIGGIIGLIADYASDRKVDGKITLWK